MFGIQKYDKEGKPICKICDKSYHRLIAHVRQTHNLSGRGYRDIFGFCKSFSFISNASKELARENVFNNMKCININLVKMGEESRFKKGESKCTHIMTAQRFLILAENRSHRKRKV